MNSLLLRRLNEFEMENHTKTDQSEKEEKEQQHLQDHQHKEIHLDGTEKREERKDNLLFNSNSSNSNRMNEKFIYDNKSSSNKDLVEVVSGFRKILLLEKLTRWEVLCKESKSDVEIEYMKKEFPGKGYN